MIMPIATTSLTLATQKPFGTLTCDFYKDNSGEFYMTRVLRLDRHWNMLRLTMQSNRFMQEMQTVWTR